MKITNFSCFKNKQKEKDDQPDYKLSAKVGDEYVSIGAGWIKDGANGKFISFKLTEPYEARNGFHIEIDLAPRQPKKEAEEEIINPADVPPVVDTRVSEHDQKINADDIPF